MGFDLGFRAGHLLTMRGGSGEVIRDGFVGIIGSRIAEVGPYQPLHQKDSLKFLDLGNQILMPGLVNAHTHLAMSLFRGFEDDLPLQEWLFNRIIPLEAKMVDAEFVRIGATLSALECIRFGTTTVNDMYFFADVTAEVLDSAGIRARIAWPFMDHKLLDDGAAVQNNLESKMKRFRAFHDHWKNHSRIRAVLGPHAPYTCDDHVLYGVKELSETLGIPIHMHVSETKKEVEDSLRSYGKTPVRRLFELGLLSPRFQAAHAVHLSPDDMECLRKTGASVLYNPDSNMKLGSGIAPIVQYRRFGVPVGLGTDGAASNNDLSMFGAMDIGTKLQKLANEDAAAMVALDALQLATIEGARAIGMESEIGSLEVGKCADLISIRTNFPHLHPLHSIPSQLVHSCQGLEVDTVVCDGEILLQKGAFLRLSETDVYEKAEKITQQLRGLRDKNFFS
jgi:5-methylthioadenosine/S-adenosylhomocysteine deaminase